MEGPYPEKETEVKAKKTDRKLTIFSTCYGQVCRFWSERGMKTEQERLASDILELPVSHRLPMNVSVRIPPMEPCLLLFHAVSLHVPSRYRLCRLVTTKSSVRAQAGFTLNVRRFALSTSMGAVDAAALVDVCRDAARGASSVNLAGTSRIGFIRHVHP